MIHNQEIDRGRDFDWGRASEDYAKYRDIYPEEFYRRLTGRGLCVKGQKVLDIGTGTGVLPRNLYRFGAEFTGIDISENQIKKAKELAKELGQKINFQCAPAEESDFPAQSFDVITACQCFVYFNHPVLAPLLSDWLMPGGKFAVLYMAWLPDEDPIAGASEELVLKYNPSWTGCGEKRRLIHVPEVYDNYFSVVGQDVFDAAVPFTRESWNGRMKSCRGIDASLAAEEIVKFDLEHRMLLDEIAPEEFSVQHYAAVAVLEKR